MKTRQSLYSWAFYDFANTIFSAVVLTFYFPLYLTDLTQKNVHLGISTTGAMILAGVAVPWLGVLSDRTGKTKFYLIWTTLLCVFFTFCLSLGRTVGSLMIFFLLACFFFHASLVFYNALLPAVAEPKNQGWVSGLGTGLGYLGVLFSVPLAHGIDTVFGRRFVFAGAGFLFLLFSLPLFLWVPERETKKIPASVLAVAKSIFKNPALRLFLLGNFLVVEAMNAVIFWLVVYMARVFHPPQPILIVIFLGINFSAFLFGFVTGILTDRRSAQETLLVSAVCLFSAFLILPLIQNLWVFAGVSMIGGGFGFAGMWTAGRKRLLEFAPEDQAGEYFGFYNLTTKISVVWSLLFSLLADRLGFQIALLSLAIPSGLGFVLLRMSGKRVTSID